MRRARYRIALGAKRTQMMKMMAPRLMSTAPTTNLGQRRSARGNAERLREVQSTYQKICFGRLMLTLAEVARK